MTDSSPNTELAPNRGRFAKLCTAPPVSPQPRRRRRRRRPAPASSPAQAAGSALPLPAARAASPSRPPFPTRRLPPGPASAAGGLSRAGPPSGTGASRPPRPAPAGAGTHLLVLVGRHGAQRGARSARRPPPPFLPAAGPGLGWAGRASLARHGAARPRRCRTGRPERPRPTDTPPLRAARVSRSLAAIGPRFPSSPPPCLIHWPAPPVSFCCLL